MGQTPEEIEKEIAETREALGEKVDALTGQVKEGVEVARSRGMKVAGGLLAGLAALLAVKRWRNR